MRRLLLVPFALGLGLACAPTESDYVGDYISASDAARREICECDYDNLLLTAFIGGPFGSAEECVAEYGFNSAERGCIEGLFADEATDYSAVLDCRSDVANRASACLNSKTCTDTARADCVSDYYDDYEDCPTLPADVEQQLNDCLNN